MDPPPPYQGPVLTSSTEVSPGQSYQGPVPIPAPQYTTPDFAPYPPPLGTCPPIIIFLQDLGPLPTHTSCPNCNTMNITETIPTTGRLTWGLSVLIALMGGIFGCCLIPFYVPECQDVTHRCSNCKNYIGTYRRV